MKAENLVMGMKIKIPKTKMGKKLFHSAVINAAKNKKQDFLYYSGMSRYGNCDHMLSSNQNSRHGDYFLPEEMEPYIESYQLELNFEE